MNQEKRASSRAHSVNFDAGAEILLKNEIQWNEIDSLFETNARKAEVRCSRFILILGWIIYTILYLCLTPLYNSFATDRR